MRAATTRDQLLLELDAAHARLRESIGGLRDQDASAPGPHGWSVKDHLTHLTLWHEMRFFEISRVARGGQPSFPLSTEEQVTPLNEAVAAHRRGLSLAQVVADLVFAWSMVEQAIAACPEDRLEHGFSGEIGPVGTAHDLAHAEMVMALRKKESI
jgi:Protein of unknown function (DUF1706)